MGGERVWQAPVEILEDIIEKLWAVAKELGGGSAEMSEKFPPTNGFHVLEGTIGSTVKS
jgi:hypothetical protein